MWWLSGGHRKTTIELGRGSRAWKATCWSLKELVKLLPESQGGECNCFPKPPAIVLGVPWCDEG